MFDELTTPRSRHSKMFQQNKKQVLCMGTVPVLNIKGAFFIDKINNINNMIHTMSRSQVTGNNGM